jgi:hypothetical protein
MSFFGGFILGFFIGIVCVGTVISTNWEREAIEKGYAQYNSVQGNWEWKENICPENGMNTN